MKKIALAASSAISIAVGLAALFAAGGAELANGVYVI